MKVCLAINLRKKLKIEYVFNSVLKIQSMFRMFKARKLREKLTIKNRKIQALMSKIILKSHFAKLCYKIFANDYRNITKKSYLKKNTIYSKLLKRSSSSSPKKIPITKLPVRAKSHRHAGTYVFEEIEESEVVDQPVEDEDSQDEDSDDGYKESVKETHSKFHDIDVLNSLLMIENLVDMNVSVNRKSA